MNICPNLARPTSENIQGNTQKFFGGEEFNQLSNIYGEAVSSLSPFHASLSQLRSIKFEEPLKIGLLRVIFLYFFCFSIFSEYS